MEGMTGDLMREVIDLRFKIASRDRAAIKIDQASHLQSLGQCAPFPLRIAGLHFPAPPRQAALGATDFTIKKIW